MDPQAYNNTGAVDTLALARHLKANTENAVAQQFVDGAPKRKDRSLKQLTLEDMTINIQSFDYEQHFIDESLRFISCYKILPMHQIDELVKVRDQFTNFDADCHDEYTLTQNPILKQFWAQHNELFNDKLDHRKARTALYPIRSVYINYL